MCGDDSMTNSEFSCTNTSHEFQQMLHNLADKYENLSLKSKRNATTENAHQYNYVCLEVTHPMGMNQRTAFRYLRDVNVCCSG